jgi:hypothetical protein
MANSGHLLGFGDIFATYLKTQFQKKAGIPRYTISRRNI